MQESYFKLKDFLKSESQRFKDARKEGHAKDHYERQNYRYHHIAYCLIRGRTLEQIENHRLNPHPQNYSECNERYLQKRVADIRLAVEEGRYGAA